MITLIVHFHLPFGHSHSQQFKSLDFPHLWLQLHLRCQISFFRKIYTLDHNEIWLHGYILNLDTWQARILRNSAPHKTRCLDEFRPNTSPQIEIR